MRDGRYFVNNMRDEDEVGRERQDIIILKCIHWVYVYVCICLAVSTSAEEEDYRWLSNIEKNRKHATVCCKNFIAIFSTSVYQSQSHIFILMEIEG